MQPPGGYGLELPPGTSGFEPSSPRPPLHQLASTALALAILGFFGCLCCVGYLLSAGAVVAGIFAIFAIDRQPDQYRGKGVAIAGIVLGVLGPIFWLALMFFLGSFHFFYRTPVLHDGGLWVRSKSASLEAEQRASVRD